MDFHQSVYGKIFFEKQLPALTKAINRLADVKEVESKTSESETDKTVNVIYVCYEENSPELAIENGAVNEMHVATSLNDVYKWLDKRLKKAENNFYAVLNDWEKSEFYKGLTAGKECALHLYHNCDENSRLNYALTVKPFTSANGIYPRPSIETFGRLHEVMTSAEKSEKLGKIFRDQVATDNEKYQRVGYYLAKAILDNNIEDLLVAVCGWTSKSLLNIADYGTAHPNKENTSVF